MALYERVQWPPDGVLMVRPYDPALHAPGSRGRDGRCLWSDHDVEARWSVVWKGERWAVCDADLAAFARAEFGVAGSPDPVDPGTDLSTRFQDHVMTEVRRLRGRYDPHVFLRMVADHGAVAATKQLLADGRRTSYGFERLWELGELQSSVEFAVWLPWFAELFEETEREKARQRLLDHHFPFSERLAAASARPPAWVGG